MTEADVRFSFVKFKEDSAARDPVASGTSGYKLEWWETDRNSGVRVYDLAKIGDQLVITHVPTGKQSSQPWVNVKTATVRQAPQAAQKGGK